MTGMMTLLFLFLTILPPQFYYDQLSSLPLFTISTFLLLFLFTIFSERERIISPLILIPFYSTMQHTLSSANHHQRSFLSPFLFELLMREKKIWRERGTGVKNLFYCLFGLFTLQHNFTSKSSPILSFFQRVKRSDNKRKMMIQRGERERERGCSFSLSSLHSLPLLVPPIGNPTSSSSLSSPLIS